MTSDVSEPARAVFSEPRIVASSLIAVMALELFGRLSGAEAVRMAGWIVAIATAVVSRRRLGLREGYLLTLCLLLSAALLAWAPAAGPAIAAALDQAVFLMAFVLLLGLLHEAAARSPSVEACGTYLTRQPPARRYFALYSGTGVMAVLFNLGVASLLVPLIQRGIESATPADALNSIRERRQISALLRGFAWSVIWSPTAVAPLALIELIPGADRQFWTAAGLVVFALMMVLGAAEDRLRFRKYRPSGASAAPPFPTRPAFLFLGACTWLLAMTLGVVWLTGDTVVFGLMLACPMMLFGWVAAQNLGSGRGWPAFRSRLGEVAWGGLPKAAPVAVTLACSGYIGRAAATLVPGEALATTLGLAAMPDYLLLSLLPVALALLSLFALSPIMMAVFFGSFFGGLPVLPADPTLIALAISCGWALSMTVSPFATVVLMIARVGDIAPTTQTWRWNFLFSLLATLSMVPVFAVLTGGR